MLRINQLPHWNHWALQKYSTLFIAQHYPVYVEFNINAKPDAIGVAREHFDFQAQTTHYQCNREH